MLRVLTKCVNREVADDWVCLDYALRQKSRQRVTSALGRDLALLLPRGTQLRSGDHLLAEDTTVIRVIATAEQLSRVECVNASDLARAAYHLGNRHVAVEIGTDFIAYQADHVLDSMLCRMGFVVCPVLMPFTPEPGAYQHHDWGIPEVALAQKHAELP